MKKFFNQNKKTLVFILVLICIWRIFLFFPMLLGRSFLQQREGFIGEIPWSNFDGMHYLSIAQNGYYQYEQAFFPLFPFLIKYIAPITFGNYLWAGLLVVHVTLFLWLFVLYKLLQLDFKDNTIKWILIFYLFSPVGFFFGSVYTETLFLLLVSLTFYFSRKQNWILVGIFTGLASATKLIGIFLVPILLIELYLMYKKNIFSVKHLKYMLQVVILGCTGLFTYMYYLWTTYKDPLFFIHAQPAFGANRTGGEIILLPQVFYRYIKIFLTVPFSNYDTWIALLEFTTMLLCLGLICYALYRRNMRVTYLLFALAAIIGPTLTGSLSSIPRYALVAFPVFIMVGAIKNSGVKIMLLTVSVILLIVFTSYFLQGYFIA